MSEGKSLMDVSIPENMRELVMLQDTLYGDCSSWKKVPISKHTDLVPTILHLVTIRPFLLDKIADFCLEYNDGTEFWDSFKDLLIEDGFNEHIALIHRLFEKEAYSSDEILQHLKDHQDTFKCLYFLDLIDDFEELTNEYEEIHGEFGSEYYISNRELLNNLIRYGFDPSTLAYTLKYDVIENLEEQIRSLDSKSSKTIEWSDFDWANIPDSLGLLSFCAFFGSTKCFMSLLSKGFQIDLGTIKNATCSGKMELIELCKNSSIEYSSCISDASNYCHSQILDWLRNQFPSSKHSFINNNFCRTILLSQQEIVEKKVSKTLEIKENGEKKGSLSLRFNKASDEPRKFGFQGLRKDDERIPNKIHHLGNSSFRMGLNTFSINSGVIIIVLRQPHYILHAKKVNIVQSNSSYLKIQILINSVKL